MKTFKFQDALTAMNLVAGLIGLGLLGLAFGHSLKPDTQWTMSQHPLFDTGMACLATSIVCSILLFRVFGSDRAGVPGDSGGA